jgi:hypothetical protein
MKEVYKLLPITMLLTIPLPPTLLTSITPIKTLLSLPLPLPLPLLSLLPTKLLLKKCLHLRRHHKRRKHPLTTRPPHPRHHRKRRHPLHPLSPRLITTKHLLSSRIPKSLLLLVGITKSIPPAITLPLSTRVIIPGITTSSTLPSFPAK